jgi:hypothetical protein
LAKPAIYISLAIYLPAYFLLKYDLFADYAKLFLVWTLVIIVYMVYRFLMWLINSYVVTDQRLVAIRYLSLFKKQVTECHLSHILNVSYSTTGFFSSLFNFGNVEVRVAGLDHPLVLERLRKPENLKTFLWSLREHHASANTRMAIQK